MWGERKREINVQLVKCNSNTERHVPVDDLSPE